MSERLATIADVERLEREALAARLGFVTPLERLRAHASRDGGRTCVHLWTPDGGTSWSRARLVAAADGLAAWLVTRAPRPIVAIALPNVPEALIATLAAMECGVAFPLNPALSHAELIQLVLDARANVLVYAAPEVDASSASAGEALLAQCPGLCAAVRVGGSEQGRRTTAWNAAVSAQAARALPPRRHTDVAALFHTGGTTARPKLAQLTLRNVAFTAWLNSVVMELDEGATVLNGLPLFHVTGMFVNSLSPLVAGGRVVLLGPTGFRSPDALDAFFGLVEQWRATTFTAVPTVFDALNDRPVGGHDLSSVRHATCGAAMAASRVLDLFEQRTGIRVLEGYGLTEATVSCARNPRDGENRRGTVGLRHPYVDVRVGVAPFDGDAGRSGVGTLWVKGPNVFAGYVGRGESEAPVDGWLCTGDLGRIDPDGYITVTGRAKDVIVRGGHNIDPRKIESALLAHPRVREVAAVGMIDARLGERPVAFAVAEGDPSALSDELLELAKRTVGERAARPSDVFVVPELPRTAVGKVHKPTLRAWAARAALQRVLQECVGDAAAIASVEPTASGTLVAVIAVDGRRVSPDGFELLQASLGRLAGIDVRLSGVSYSMES